MYNTLARAGALRPLGSGAGRAGARVLVLRSGVPVVPALFRFLRAPLAHVRAARALVARRLVAAAHGAVVVVATAVEARVLRRVEPLRGELRAAVGAPPRFVERRALTGCALVTTRRATAVGWTGGKGGGWVGGGEGSADGVWAWVCAKGADARESVWVGVQLASVRAPEHAHSRTL